MGQGWQVKEEEGWSANTNGSKPSPRSPSRLTPPPHIPIHSGHPIRIHILEETLHQSLHSHSNRRVPPRGRSILPAHLLLRLRFAETTLPPLPTRFLHEVDHDPLAVVQTMTVRIEFADVEDGDVLRLEELKVEQVGVMDPGGVEGLAILPGRVFRSKGQTPNTQRRFTMRGPTRAQLTGQTSTPRNPWLHPLSIRQHQRQSIPRIIRTTRRSASRHPNSGGLNKDGAVLFACAEPLPLESVAAHTVRFDRGDCRVTVIWR